MPLSSIPTPTSLSEKSDGSLAWPELPAVNLREFTLWLLQQRKRVRVKGSSMLPLLQPDEEVLVNLNAYHSSPKQNGVFLSFLTWWSAKSTTTSETPKQNGVFLSFLTWCLANPTATLKAHTPQPGDVVIVCHPQMSGLKMVKRVVKIISPSPATLLPASPGAMVESEDLEQYWVEGDNPLASTDSRTFGPVTAFYILGQVTARFA